MTWIRLAGVLLRNGVPVWGILYLDWSPATLLVLFWLETLMVSIANLMRIHFHASMTRTTGHCFAPIGEDFSKRGDAGRGLQHRAAAGRDAQPPSLKRYFVHFAWVVTPFTLVHGVFLAMLLLAAGASGIGASATVWIPQIDDLRLGAGVLAIAITLELLIDIPQLRHGSFIWLKERVESSLGRLLVMHLGLILGILAIDLTESPTGLFVLIIAFKTGLEMIGTTFRGISAEPPPAFLLLCKLLREDPVAEWARIRSDYEAASRLWNAPLP